MAQLRQVLTTVDPHSDRARQGYVLLGNVEESRGNFAAAADAWGKALDVKFDPLLAARSAEASSPCGCRVSPASAALFRRALAEAPPRRALAGRDRENSGVGSDELTLARGGQGSALEPPKGNCPLETLVSSCGSEPFSEKAPRAPGCRPGAQPLFLPAWKTKSRPSPPNPTPSRRPRRKSAARKARSQRAMATGSRRAAAPTSESTRRGGRWPRPPCSPAGRRSSSARRRLAPG